MQVVGSVERHDIASCSGFVQAAKTVWSTEVHQSYNCLGSVTCCFVTIRYDTVDLRVLKSWRDGQLNLLCCSIHCVSWRL